MKPKIRNRRSTIMSCLAGLRSPVPAIVWSVLGCILIVHFYTSNLRSSHEKIRAIRSLQLSAARDLAKIEEEIFHLPPPRARRSPRAIKRRGPRKPPTIIDEFLDESSDLRSFFFPGQSSAVDPAVEGDQSHFFYPGRVWLDTDSNPIQAHGGGILYVESSATYYWYGENKDGPTYLAHKKATARVDIVGVSCYSSKDLWAWKNEGVVLAAEKVNASHDLHVGNVLERPKVVYNELAQQYVMWMHVDDVNYTKAAVGVAVSRSPTGPFDFLYSKRPHGCESRDMTVFKDDDGAAFLVYSSADNSELHVGLLTVDYLDLAGPVRRVLVGRRREAPAMFKHEGTYYMITSGCTGWAPNRAEVHAAESIMGPWETMGSPCVGGNKIFRETTFFAQGSFVLPLRGLPGWFVFIADRWNVADLRDSRYVWLPLRVGGAVDELLENRFRFPVWSRVSVFWHRHWQLPQGWG
ncbi:uncharacterized protein LOC144711924 [Wolffia australiana]